MATHRYNIENATAQLIVVSFNECEIKRHLYREYALPYENARRGVNTKQKAE